MSYEITTWTMRPILKEVKGHENTFEDAIKFAKSLVGKFNKDDIEIHGGEMIRSLNGLEINFDEVANDIIETAENKYENNGDVGNSIFKIANNMLISEYNDKISKDEFEKLRNIMAEILYSA